MDRLSSNRWVEIHLEALEHNVKQIRARMEPATRLIAVVKADAYGLGAVEVAWQLSQLGVDYFAVTFLQEAVELRRHGIENDILIFSPLGRDEVRTAIENNFTVTVGSGEDLVVVQEVVDALRRSARIHIKVDTGLGRFGVSEVEAVSLARQARSSENILLEGIYTHFAEAGRSRRYTMKQFDRFMAALAEIDLQGIQIPIRHCCSSSAFLKYPFMHLDGVRIGTLLGGQMPSGRYEDHPNLKDPYRFRARIVSVRTLKKGDYIGYYRTYHLRADTAVAVVPAGFIDGLGVRPVPVPSGRLELFKAMAGVLASYFQSNRTAMKAYVHGKPIYIRGRVFMQFCLAEIPNGLEVNPGDIVDLPVRRTMVSRFVPRMYTRDGQPGKIEHSLKKVIYTSGEEQ
ncbi:MAG: alanine racemase [Solirubrobacterales bacterium]